MKQQREQAMLNRRSFGIVDGKLTAKAFDNHIARVRSSLIDTESKIKQFIRAGSVTPMHYQALAEQISMLAAYTVLADTLGITEYLDQTVQQVLQETLLTQGE